MMNFIHNLHPFLFHPCPCGKIFFHVIFYFSLHGKEYSKNMLSMSSKHLKKRFYHAHVLTFTHSQDNIVVTTTSQILITFNICHGFLACKMKTMRREIQGAISQTKAIVNVTNVWFFTFECQKLYYITSL